MQEKERSQMSHLLFENQIIPPDFNKFTPKEVISIELLIISLKITFQADSSYCTRTKNVYFFQPYNISRSTTLQIISIKITDQAYCRYVYKNQPNFLVIYDTQICADDTTCQVSYLQNVTMHHRR